MVKEVTERNKIANNGLQALDSTSVHVNEGTEDARAVERILPLTNVIGSHQPSSLDPSLQGRVSQIQATPFPHLAWEAVQAGLAKETLTRNQINAHVEEAQNINKKIDLLLDLSAELTSQKDGKEMSDGLKNLLSTLKEQGIDLWKSGETVLSKEKISELKSLSSAQVDKQRSNLQIIFTTKIQTQVQAIGAIMEALKDIIRNNSRLISTANRLPGH